MKLKKIILGILLVSGAIYFFCGRSIWMAYTTVGYQAVFLENGQVYFGKLSTSGRFLKLTDVYYLQANGSLQQAGELEESGPNQNIQLVKLGDELHGPADLMYISKDKVLFWENLKDNGKVVEAIDKYQTK